MTDAVSSYYGESYFARQLPDGKFGAFANLFLYRDYIAPDARLIELGCGGGFSLEAIECREKLGVEINPAARACAQARGISTVADLSELPDDWADVAISNHALEHMTDPFDKVKLVLRKLKPGARAVFVVPCERYDTRYVEDNWDQHLYTWSPVNLGNLFRHAGFTIESCERVAHRWPPRAALIQRLVGWHVFHIISRIYARISPRLTQVRVIARKPALG